MVGFEQINKPSQKGEEFQSNRARTQWQRPTLTFLGKVGDLVQGFGKSGWKMDSDPTGSRNKGKVPWPDWPPWD